MKTVSTAELVQRISRDTATPETEARTVLDHAIDVIKKELQRGNGVELSQFMSVQVKMGQPESTPTQGGGTIELPSQRVIQIDLDETLRRAVEGTGMFQIMLVVPKHSFFTSIIESRLASGRSEVALVVGVEQALVALANTHFDLIVVDNSMPNASKILESVKKNRASSLTSVVLVANGDYSSDKISGLTVIADEVIREPFEINDLVKVAESELARCTEERNYFEHVLHFKVQTSEEAVDQANDVMTELLAHSNLPEEAASAMTAAFREAVDNAARHGNKSNPETSIEVQYLVDREKVTVSVADQGNGFDTEVYLSRGITGNPVEAARERSESGEHGGLGIMLMLKCVDKLEYNYTGNKITLTRMIRK